MITSFDDPRLARFREDAREWLQLAIPREWRDHELDLTEDEAVALRRAWDRTLYLGGYAGLSWPGEVGGKDAGPVMEVAFHEELARARAPEGFSRIGRVMVGPILIASGTAAQRERFLPGILDGSEIWCLGYSEPTAGSDLAALRTKAVRVPGGYLVSGTKTWTSYANHADHCMLLARTDTDGPAREQMNMLAVDMIEEGIEISPLMTIAGDVHFNEVRFDNVFVAEADRIGPHGGGWQVFRKSLAAERGMTVALNHYMDLVREVDVLRTCCAPRCPDRGATSFADALDARVEIVRWHILKVSELAARDEPATRERLVFKLYWSELAQQLATFGERVSCPRHRDFWRYRGLRARAATIYGGTSEIQRDTIARRAVFA